MGNIADALAGFAAGFGGVGGQIASQCLAQQELDQRRQQQEFYQGLASKDFEQRQRLFDQAQEDRSYEKSVLRSYDEALRNLQIEQATGGVEAQRRAARLDKWNATQQAQLQAQFPWLAGASVLAPLAKANAEISSLNEQTAHYKAATKLAEEDAAQSRALVDHFTGKRQAVASVLLDSRTKIDDTLNEMEKYAPGLSFTGKERQGFYDLGAQAVDSGVPIENLAGLMQQYVSTNPRFASRLAQLDASLADPGATQVSDAPPTQAEHDAIYAPGRALRGEALQADIRAEMDRLLHAIPAARVERPARSDSFRQYGGIGF